jgi:hypothetical protein
MICGAKADYAFMGLLISPLRIYHPQSKLFFLNRLFMPLPAHMTGS